MKEQFVHMVFNQCVEYCATDMFGMDQNRKSGITEPDIEIRTNYIMMKQ